MTPPAADTPKTSDIAPLFEQGHLRLKSCRHGAMLYNSGDTYVGRSLDVYGEFSEGEIKVFDQVLKPGMIAIDAGANIALNGLEKSLSD